jgi:hypothetical protein
MRTLAYRGSYAKRTTEFFNSILRFRTTICPASTGNFHALKLQHVCKVTHVSAKPLDLYAMHGVRAHSQPAELKLKR